MTILCLGFTSERSNAICRVGFVLKVAQFFDVTTDQLLRDDIELGEERVIRKNQRNRR